MCIKIIRYETEKEFSMSEPLAEQICDAREIRVDFDPEDPKIDCFVGQMEIMVQNGNICKADIKVNPNNSLSGLRLERKLEKLKQKLDVNEVIRGLCHLATETDNRLSELSKICTGKLDEQ